MRFLLLFSFSLLFTTSSCAQTGAGVEIPAGQTFILGEYRKDGYRATLRNRGGQEITAAIVEQGSGATVSSIALPAGDKQSVTVADGQEVHLINKGDRAASIRVSSPVKGIEGMRYVGGDEAGGKERVIIHRPAPAAAPLSPEESIARTTASATLQPGQTFVVGEADRGDFTVSISNRGSDIKVSGRTAGGKQTQGFGLGRFGKVKMTLRPGEVLHFVNDSGKASTVKVKMNRPVKGARVVQF